MIDKSKDKRNSRLETVKGYLLAAFPNDKLQVESYDSDLSWHIKIIRAYQVVHEAWVTRPFLDDEDSNPDPVAALTLWGLAAKMNMNGTSPVTVGTQGLST